MAFSSRGPLSSGSLTKLKLVLFDACQAAGPVDQNFTQEDLLTFNIVPNGDVAVLANVIQILTDEKLFIPSRLSDGRLAWRWRDPEEAAKYVASASVLAMSFSRQC